MVGAPYGNTNAEIWTRITLASNYLISNYGRIYSILSDRIMKPNLSGAGYLKTDIRGDVELMTVYVHKLVANHFLKNPAKFDCINHIDGNKQNNNMYNLEYCTYSYNLKHAYELGLKGSGENHANAKLKNDEVLSLREDRNKGMKYSDLCRKYSISLSVAHRVVNKKHYSSI